MLEEKYYYTRFSNQPSSQYILLGTVFSLILIYMKAALTAKCNEKNVPIVLFIMNDQC